MLSEGWCNWEAVAAPRGPVVPEVGALQRQIDDLDKERDQLRQTVCKGVPKPSQGEWFSDVGTDLDKVPPSLPLPTPSPHLIRSPGFGRMVVQQELRVAQYPGTRRCRVDCKARHFVEPKSSSVGVDYSRRTDGLEVQVVQDVRIDRRSRFKTQMS